MKTAALLTAACFALVAFAAPVAAQKTEVLTPDIKDDKRPLVDKAMQLTEAEARGFWPIYDDYQKQLAKSYEREAKMIADYAAAYGKGPIPDAQAKRLVAESLAIEEASTKLRREYMDKFARVLPGAKVLRYLLIESKIKSVILYQVSNTVPLPQ